jgi:hypothetical protein
MYTLCKYGKSIRSVIAFSKLFVKYIKNDIIGGITNGKIRFMKPYNKFELGNDYYYVSIKDQLYKSD